MLCGIFARLASLRFHCAHRSSAAGRFWPRWRFSPVHAVLLAGTGLYTMSLMTNISEFLYFQF